MGRGPTDRRGAGLLFFGYGSDFKSALYDFTQIAGKISLPPHFAFGVWYSRYWNYTEAELKEIAADYERNNIPLRCTGDRYGLASHGEIQS
jgi:alpha-glucosidase (family GH31 glycosyl hydrolase)